MLFMTPEKLAKSHVANKVIADLYRRDMIDRVVIDEAHCLSQWGREFRPDYLNLKMIREKYPKIPILAITATAPNIIREDVITLLKMRDCLFFRCSYNRPNLYINVREKNNNPCNEIGQMIKSKYNNKSGIIYCISKKDCENLQEKLSRNYGINCGYYHAGMPSQEKNKYSK